MQFPESYNPYDMERFFEIFTTAKECEDLQNLKAIDLTAYVRTNKPLWSDDDIEKFVNEWIIKIELCADLMQYVHDK